MDIDEARKIVTEICKAQIRGCYVCPLAIKYNNMQLCGVNSCLSKIKKLDNDEVIAICEKWKADHALIYPTFAEWQKTTFPNHYLDICPAIFMSKAEIQEQVEKACCGISCYTCRNSIRIPKSVAEKLGVKPRVLVERNEENDEKR